MIGRMSGGMPGGGTRDRGWGYKCMHMECQWRVSDGFQEGRVSRGCPGHPPGENEN